MINTKIKEAYHYFLKGTLENISRGWEVVSAPVIVILITLGCVFAMAFIISALINLGVVKGGLVIALTLFVIILIIGWSEGR